MSGTNVPDKGARIGKLLLTIVDRTNFIIFHIISLDPLGEMLLSEEK